MNRPSVFFELWHHLDQKSIAVGLLLSDGRISGRYSFSKMSKRAHLGAAIWRFSRPWLTGCLEAIRRSSSRVSWYDSTVALPFLKHPLKALRTIRYLEYTWKLSKLQPNGPGKQNKLNKFITIIVRQFHGRFTTIRNNWDRLPVKV